MVHVAFAIALRITYFNICIIKQQSTTDSCELESNVFDIAQCLRIDAPVLLYFGFTVP